MAPNTRTPHIEVDATEMADPSIVDVEPALVDVPPMSYLSIERDDLPPGAGLREAIEALQLLGGTLPSRPPDPAAQIEVLRWLPHVNVWDVTDTSTWQWRVMIARDGVGDDSTVTSIIETLRRRRAMSGLDAVRMISLHEGRCVQALHRGGPATMRRTLTRLHVFALERRLAPAGPQHDINLTDPLRTSARAMRTILRRPVLPAG